MLLSLSGLFATLAFARQSHHAVAETATIRTFFNVGGGYSEDGNTGYIFKDQMYVEKLSPVTPHRYRPSLIVLIHGQGQTGTNFLNKLDGGESWTSHFLDAGHTIYIVDQTFRGRSASAPRIGAQTPSTYR
ncbi:uncharacterized protein M421DRAFT_396638 [Didymella exigua CBS 183.55]|uniref:AB hydrolase-1 domain-containing protein n=1 Tax=Didymella exigua CBS 183.55 TaxID=1150837 RepID=A0A6A5RIR1_9PLEO|nr:uncharacterized protein M421DRAFT_396638 [Didymella exigua CBS 183.55]KAF1926336.1 hypothetical protein M421DRAFT_396638 [Didymella exigua CBS 183.55]